MFFTYRMRLLMMQDRVIGILDWELSTLGNQMCDVAYSSLVIYDLSGFTDFLNKRVLSVVSDATYFS